MHTTVKKVIDMTKPKTHNTLKEALVYKLKGLAKMVGIAAIFFLAVHWLVGGQDEIINGGYGDIPSTQAPVDRAPVKDSADFQMEKHSKTCWTSDQEPKAELPGAAIVQFKDGHAEYVTNDTPRGFKLVDAAFNEALASIGYGDKVSQLIDPIALCI